MIETVLSLLTVCFLARMSPGPDMMLLIHHAGSRTIASGNEMKSRFYGSPSAYGCVLGVCLGLTCHVTLSVLGLALVIKSNPLLFNFLRYAGAFYLLYIGYCCFTDSEHIDIQRETRKNMTCGTFRKGFRDGLFCNLLNPKVTLFILSVFMQIVGPDATLGEKVVYGSVIVSEALIGWMLFVFMLNTAFIQRIYGKYVAVMNKITGVILFALGGAIFIF